MRGEAEANSELAVHKSQGPWSNLKVKETPPYARNRLRNLIGLLRCARNDRLLNVYLFKSFTINIRIVSDGKVVKI